MQGRLPRVAGLVINFDLVVEPHSGNVDVVEDLYYLADQSRLALFGLVQLLLVELRVALGDTAIEFCLGLEVGELLQPGCEFGRRLTSVMRAESTRVLQFRFHFLERRVCGRLRNVGCEPL